MRWALRAVLLLPALLLIGMTVLAGATSMASSGGTSAIAAAKQVAISQAAPGEPCFIGPLAARQTGDPEVAAAVALVTAGWAGPHLRTALMVVGAESDFDPRAGNRLADGRTHVGYFQISSLHTELIVRFGERTDPVANARMGLALFRSVGERWSPTWEAYTNGRYLGFGAAADRALERLGVAQAHDDAAPCEPDAPPTSAAPCASGASSVQGPVSPRGETPIRWGPIRVCQVAGTTLRADLAARWGRLVAAARADGLELGGGGWRSSEEQIRLRKQRCGALWNDRSCTGSPPTALPGTSQHERAAAVDITSSGVLITSRVDRAFLWLERRAAAFGFFNLPSEPWHWSETGG